MKKIYTIGIMLVILATITTVSAFDFPWEPNHEERYATATETRIKAKEAYMESLIAEKNAHGDLAAEKASIALDNDEFEEVERLASIAKGMKKEIERLEEFGGVFDIEIKVLGKK